MADETNTTSSGSLTGFGGNTTWDALREYTLQAPEDITRNAAQLSATYNTLFGGAAASLEEINRAASTMMSGQIPEDVQKQVRQLTSEAAGFRGIFGQAGRVLTARDIGKTSYEIAQAGIATKQNVVGAQGELAKLAESIRQFNETQAAQARQTNLQALNMEENRLQFNAAKNLAVATTIIDLVKSQQTMAVNYMQLDRSAANMMTTFNNWITELRKLLA